MFEVSREILVRCCIIIIIAYLLCETEKENFIQDWGQTVTPSPVSVTPFPTPVLNENTDKSQLVPILETRNEIGGISKFGDTVVLLRKEGKNCKPTIRTRNVKDIMPTSAGLRKDLRRFGDIMTSNFQDDSKKLTELFRKMDSNRHVYKDRNEKDYAAYQNEMSVSFGYNKEGLLLSYPAPDCIEEVIYIVHIRVIKLNDGTYDHGSFLTKTEKVDTKDIVPVRVARGNSFLYVLVDGERYALTIITSRDSNRNTVHNVDLTKIPADTDQEMIAPPNTLQLWSDNQDRPTLEKQIVAEYTNFDDYFKDAFYRIQRRVVSLSGVQIKTAEQKSMMSVTLPPIPSGVSERELYVKKINAEVAAAAEKALSATEEVSNITALHSEASGVALDALSAKTQSGLKLTQKKEELESAKSRMKKAKEELGLKNREFEMRDTNVKKLEALIEERTERIKNIAEMIIKKTKDNSQGEIDSEITKANEKLQEESNELVDQKTEYTREKNQINAQKQGLQTELSALKTNLQIIEGEIESIKDSVESAEIANRARTDATAKTTSIVKDLRSRIEPAKKAEKQMNQIAQQLEKDAVLKIAEFDKKMKEKTLADSKKIELQYAADQAAEARAREERLTYEAKIRASSAGNIENINSATRTLLKKASKELDSQREAAARLEDQVDSLVSALQNQDTKVADEAEKSLVETFKQAPPSSSWTRYSPKMSKQFSKYL